MASGDVFYHIATEAHVYAIIKDKALFDALPGHVEEHPNLLVKMGTVGNADVIYQFWLKEPGKEQE